MLAFAPKMVSASPPLPVALDNSRFSLKGDAVQFVGAERHDDQHVAERTLIADEEGDQVAA